MFDFVEIESEMFSDNLILIDSALPEIVAAMLLRFYLGSKPSSVDLITGIGQDNLLNFNTSNKYPFYFYKVKRMLNHVALGMLPDRLWKGECSLYDEATLDDSLINNTEFEEESNPRHEFGKIYIENKKLYINLNLQIRNKIGA